MFVSYPFFLNDRWRACFESPIECGVVLVGLFAWGLLPFLVCRNKGVLVISLMLRSRQDFVGPDLVSGRARVGGHIGNSRPDTRSGPTRRVTSVISVIWLGLVSYGVGLTGSRGPLLGLFISALGMVYLIKVHFAEKFRLALIPLGVGGLSLLASILLSPARERIGANMAGDNSVLNRLEIWKASGQIIGNTHGGVGYGESGYFYSQWFQSFGGEYVYTGLLNSYFEIAVEFGGIVLLAGIFIASVLAYSLAGIRLKAGGSNLLKPLAVCAGTSLLGIAVCALTSSAHTYAVVRLIVLLDAAILVVWLVVFRKMLAWKKVIACAGLSVLAVASGLFAWGKVYENRYEVKASLGPWGVVHLWKEGRTESGRHLLVMPDRAELGHLYGKKIRTMLLLNKQYFDFWVCDPRKPLPKSLPAGDYDVLVFGEAVQWLQGLKAPGMKRWHVVNPRGDYCGAPEGVEMVVWLPEFDVLGKDGPWRENKGNAHLRESKSRGGVISMADIKNMEGFLEL